MRDKARDYKTPTLKRLHTLSGNQCAEPNCTEPLIARDGETIISKICHIEAASSKGPRYNPAMTDDERRHFNNLILLCDECHNIIDNKDNEEIYPVSLLKKWKRNHESKLLNQFTAHPSLLAHAINAIADATFEEVLSEDTDFLRGFDIEDKIEHNAIKRNKSLIDEYKVFHAKINTIYDELEKQGSFKKDNLLRNVQKIYLKTKGKYIENCNNHIEAIRRNADNIIEDIEVILVDSIDTSHYKEDVSFGVTLIMVDAFMRCKILENPSN